MENCLSEEDKDEESIVIKTPSEASERILFRVEYVVVAAEYKTSEPIELPLDSDGFLTLSTLHIEFPGSNGIKYLNPVTGLFRVIAPDQNGRLAAPPIGWKNTLFLVCNSAPPIAASVPLKRPLPHAEFPPTKFASSDSYPTISKSDGSGFSTSNRCSRPSNSTVGSRSDGGGAYGSTQSYGHNSSAPSPSHISTSQAPGKTFDHCSVCNCDLNSAGQAEMHYTGKKHLEALTRNGVVVSMVARGRGRAGISGSGFTRGRGYPTRLICRTLPSAANINSQLPQFDFTDDTVSSASEFSNYSYGPSKLGASYVGR